MEKLKDVSQLFNGAILFLTYNNKKLKGFCNIIKKEGKIYLISLNFPGLSFIGEFNDYYDTRFYLDIDAGLPDERKRYLDISKIEIFDHRLNKAKEMGKLHDFMELKNKIVKYTNRIIDIPTYITDPDLYKSGHFDFFQENSAVIRDTINFIIKVLRNRCFEIHDEIENLLKKK